VWSRKHESCVVCGKTDHPHYSRGKCSQCYLREYRGRAENKVKHREQAAHWGRENGRVVRDKKHFAGQREVLLTGKTSCELCGSSKQLVVHHKDGKGRDHPSPNNSPENLQVLCRACHARVHRTNVGWSRDFECCVDCGTTTVRHRSKGRCLHCSDKFYRANRAVWSTNFSCCKGCGTTEKPHAGHGLCGTCLTRAKRHNINPEDMVRS